MDEFEKGESIGREITITASGIDDLDDFDTIEVSVYHWLLFRNAGTYSLALGNLTKNDPTTLMKVFFDVPPSITNNIRRGKYRYQLSTTEADGDYDNGIRVRTSRGWCFKLI